MKNKKLVLIALLTLGIVLTILTALYFFKQKSELTKNEITNLESKFAIAGFNGEDEIVVGEYGGRSVVARYFCSDVCNENETDNTFIVYEDVEESECTNLNGSIVEVYGWGRFYVGCSPLSN